VKDVKDVLINCAVHKLAFELDCEAKEPELVELLYKTAIKTDPKFLVAHSNYIVYLLTRGRIKEAEDAFIKANAENPVYSSDVLFNLYVPVVYWSLYWGEEVLASVILNRIKLVHIKGFTQVEALYYWREWLDRNKKEEGPWNEEKQCYEQLPYDEIQKNNLPKLDRNPNRWYNRAVNQAWESENSCEQKK